jgi:DNA-binding response OmpR family regulator
MARTILIADDSPTIRKIVELTFSDTDIRVESARSGGEALDRLASGQPDLVLADVVMPAPNGYELCRSIKSSERPVPVVLLAGTFEPFDADRARDCGADDHLVKPFESEALRSRVRELLDRPSGAAAVAIEEPAIEEPAAELPPDTAPVLPAAADESEPWAETPPEPPRELAISAELVEAVAEAVVRRLSPDLLREVALRVVPELASEIIRERIRELEREELEEETGRS